MQSWPTFDLWWPLTFMIGHHRHKLASGILSYQCLVTRVQRLPQTTCDDLWPVMKVHGSASILAPRVCNILLSIKGDMPILTCIFFTFYLWLTFDLHEGHASSWSFNLRYSSDQVYSPEAQSLPVFDPWWPLTSMKVIIMINSHQEICKTTKNGCHST